MGLGKSGGDAFGAGEFFFEVGNAYAGGVDVGEVVCLWLCVFGNFLSLERRETRFQGLDSLWKNKEAFLGTKEATKPTAGFVGEFGGSESAWNRGAFGADGRVGDSFAVVKAAEEAVLCVGAVCRVTLHIAMLFVCCLVLPAEVLERCCLRSFISWIVSYEVKSDSCCKSRFSRSVWGVVLTYCEKVRTKVGGFHIKSWVNLGGEF